VIVPLGCLLHQTLNLSDAAMPKTVPTIVRISAFQALMCCLIALIASFAGTYAQAELMLSNVFGDGMVLQRDKPVNVWGWAEPGQLVQVNFAGQAEEAVADAEGKWVTTFEPMAASFEPRSLSVMTDGEQLHINNVLVGEVWICGGQSNMEWAMLGTLEWDVEGPSANWPAIRYISLPNIASPEVQRDIPVAENGGWQVCSPETVGNFTGVGYYFACRLHRYLGVPVGIIDNSWGGTAAQHWCSHETLEGLEHVQPYIERFDEAVAAYVDGGGAEGAQRRYEADLAAWETARAEAERAGQPEPRRPNPNGAQYIDPRGERQPAGMYNTLVRPLAGLSIRGVLWYQGENNAFGEDWRPYMQTAPAVIADWRENFGDDELPFGMIQIAGWANRRTMDYDQNHHTNIVREVQFNVWQSTPNTGLIVSYDGNTDGNIHPRNKQTVGERSARWALAEVYGATVPGSDRPIPWRGPIYRSYEVVDGRIVIQMDPETSQGLHFKLDTAQGFYIAGEDHEFHIADASVNASDSTVTVWSEDVPEPAAVRYAVSNLPNGTLLNGQEIPAYPFRTDTWPITPHRSTGSYHVELDDPVVEN